jgi:hypothetical protein
MSELFVALTSVAAAWLAAFVGFQGFAAWRRWRGTRLVTCPETGRPAAVDMDLRHAIAGAIVVGRPDLRLRDCSRWPERSRCGQVCLTEVEESPEGCLVRHMLERWYADRACAYCRKPFGVIHWHDHKPGLRGPDHELREWREVAPETLPDVLRTHAAVCWNCLIAEGFRLRFPDLVVERPATHHSDLTPPPA